MSLDWIKVFPRIRRHWKTAVFADVLKLRDRPHRLIVDLWLWTSDERPSGNLTGLPPSVLAEAAGWPGDPELFVHALLKAELLDEDGRIHDWDEHQPAHVQASRSAPESKADRRRRLDRERKRAKAPFRTPETGTHAEISASGPEAETGDLTEGNADFSPDDVSTRSAEDGGISARFPHEAENHAERAEPSASIPHAEAETVRKMAPVIRARAETEEGRRKIETEDQVPRPGQAGPLEPGDKKGPLTGAAPQVTLPGLDAKPPPRSPPDKPPPAAHVAPAGDGAAGAAADEPDAKAAERAAERADGERWRDAALALLGLTRADVPKFGSAWEIFRKARRRFTTPERPGIEALMLALDGLRGHAFAADAGLSVLLSDFMVQKGLARAKRATGQSVAPARHPTGEITIPPPPRRKP